MLSGAEVTSDEPIGLQGGLPVAESVVVAVLTAVLVLVGTTIWVLVWVVISDEAVWVTVTITVVGTPSMTVVLVHVVVSWGCVVGTAIVGVAEAPGAPGYHD